MNLKGVEIFAVGKWNGFSFSLEDLEGIASAWHKLSSVHKVPLKLGHNEEQDMTDGFPALGWVKNVRVQNDKLVADFDHVPDIVHDAIQSKLYNSVSIELDVGVEYKGNNFDYVLSGVALLGADIPAVNTLEDLSAFIESEDDAKFTASKKLSFTFKSEGEPMDAIDEMKAKFSALESRQKLLEDQLKAEQEKSLKFETENTQLKLKQEDEEKKRKLEVFSAKKEQLVTHMDDMVKADVLTPGQRESFTAKITEDNIDQLVDTINVLGEGKNFSKKEETKDVKTDDISSEPDKDIVQKISEVQLENPNISFSRARDMVFKANPDLAKAYITMHDGGQS